jgi:protein-tyrosine phosphatase
MGLFREVTLPDGVPGRLLLHSMPGYEEGLDEAWESVRQEGVSLILCLTALDEVRDYVPDYAQAIESAACPCEVRLFPVPDHGVPETEGELWTAAREVAERLRAGEAVLIHCWFGIGRTGMLAVAVLLALGLSLEDALEPVATAGSWPESPAQRALLERLARDGAGP